MYKKVLIYLHTCNRLLAWFLIALPIVIISMVLCYGLQVPEEYIPTVRSVTVIVFMIVYNIIQAAGQYYYMIESNST